MSRRNSVLFGLLAAMLASANDARATMVSLNGSTIASDNFEGDTVGAPPVADVGVWSNVNFVNRTIGEVTNAALPGASSGSQYFSLFKDGSSVYQGIFAEMSLASSDLIHFESMVYIPLNTAAENFPWQIGIASVASPGSRLINIWRNASGLWEAQGMGAFAGPASLLFDTWQKWELDFVVGASAATLTINGVSASVPATNTTLNTNPAYRLGVWTNGPADNQIYLDNITPVVEVPAVPEPSTAALLLTFAAAFVFGRRR